MFVSTKVGFWVSSASSKRPNASRSSLGVSLGASLGSFSLTSLEQSSFGSAPPSLEPLLLRPPQGSP